MNRYSIDGKEQIKTFYDNRESAEDYFAARFTEPLWLALHEIEVATLNRFLKQARPGTVLEIAPGPGRISSCIDTSLFEKAWGIDASQKMLNIARENVGNKKWEFIESDAFALPVFKKKFDVAMSFRFIRHFRLGERERLYAEIGKVLKPGGFLVFEALNKNMSEYAKQRTGLDVCHIYDELWDLTTLGKELGSNNFVLFDAIPVVKHFELAAVVEKISQKLRLKNYAKSIIKALETIPTKNSYEWMVVCKKG